MLGLVLAQLAGQALTAFMPTSEVPVVEQRPMDPWVYLFTFLVSAVAGIGTGLWPARRATRFDLVETLKDSASLAGTSRHRFRNLLVIGQVTMSLVVLISAGLFLHSLMQMQHIALGFKPERLLMMSIDLELQQYTTPRGLRFVEELLTRAEALPGVEKATVSSHVPFDYGMQITDVAIDGTIPGSKDEYASSAFNVVGPNFFDTTGAVLIQGRGFDETDDERSRRVAVVNQAMARKLWPSEDPIGRRFRLGRNGPWIEVVGVASDGKYVMLAEEPRSVLLPAALAGVSLANDADGAVRIRTGGTRPAAAAPPRRDGFPPSRLQCSDNGRARPQQRVWAHAAAHWSEHGRRAGRHRAPARADGSLRGRFVRRQPAHS